MSNIACSTGNCEGDLPILGSLDEEPVRVSVCSSDIYNQSQLEVSKNVSPSVKCAKCMRCGHIVEETGAIIVTIHPPFIRASKQICDSAVDGETRCHKCGLPDSFHSAKTYSSGSEDNDSSDSMQESSSAISCSTYKTEDSLIEVEENSYDEYRENISDEELGIGEEKVLLQNHLGDKRKLKKNVLSNPCSDCHIALISECCCTQFRKYGHEVITLMLQIPPSIPHPPLSDVQTEASISKVDVGIGVNLLGVYPEMFLKPGPSTGGSLPGSKGYNKNLPELDPEAEAAYQSHLRNLIPCTHCGRTFNPDRVLVHENACIERPRKKRPRKTPKKDISK